MGSDNFFAKIASIDPIAQALRLPGYQTHARAQAEAHLPGSNGPYTGVTPTLAGANAGYLPGGPGANPWTQPQPWHQGGLFGLAQGLAGDVAGTSFGAQPQFSTQSPSSTGPVGQVNPYSAAAQKATPQPIAKGNLYGQ